MFQFLKQEKNCIIKYTYPISFHQMTPSHFKNLLIFHNIELDVILKHSDG